VAYNHLITYPPKPWTLSRHRGSALSPSLHCLRTVMTPLFVLRLLSVDPTPSMAAPYLQTVPLHSRWIWWINHQFKALTRAVSPVAQQIASRRFHSSNFWRRGRSKTREKNQYDHLFFSILYSSIHINAFLNSKSAQ
jgi:hypothetical protein